LGKKAFEEKLAALEGVRSPEALRKALGDRNNYYVAKAAALVAENSLRDLIPDLIAAFDHFLINPAKTDPQCWAKNAIVKTLKEFEYDDAAFYVRGMKHIQMEASWGPPVDTAGNLRIECAFGLTTCSLPRAEAMLHVVDLLASDAEKTVRANAARAIAQLGGVESVLLLRFKALAGDSDPEVIGQCFTGLLDLSPGDYVPFVASFLYIDGDVRFEAAAALGEFPDPAAVTALTTHFAATTDFEMRRAILLSLGASRLDAAADFLMGVLTNGDVQDAIVSVHALAIGRFKEDLREQVRGVISKRASSRLDAAFQKEFTA
jgi:hypothetical protein